MIIILGIVIGVVMGLTGAGGALIAIPLFIQFLAMSLKDATVYSLIAVIIASLSNFIFQRKHVNYQLSINFLVFSTIGSFLTNPLKQYMPEIYMAVLLALIAIYSLYSIWKSTMIEVSSYQAPHYLLTVLIGLVLGALTTFSGLGGGVLMLPILVGIYRYEQNRAIATSLLTVALSSLSSLIIQIYSGAQFQFDQQLMGLVAGIIIAALVIKLAIKKISPQKLNFTRKVIFSAVVVVALGKIFS